MRILVDVEAEDFTRILGREGVTVLDEEVCSTGFSGLCAAGLPEREARLSLSLTIARIGGRKE